MAQLQLILNSPMLTRCNDLRTIIKETYFKELQNILPTILESIFDISQGYSNSKWRIGLIKQSLHPQEFAAIRSLLSPQGPILSLCYKLSIDGSLNFEYDITNLPINTRQSLEDGVVPAFYSQKLKNDPRSFGSRVPRKICLNAFELYFFHFAHYVVNQTNQELGMLWANPEDFLYPRLLDDYLRFFLPLIGSEVPSLQELCGFIPSSYPSSQIPFSSTPMNTPPTIRNAHVTFGLSPLQASPQKAPTLLKNILTSPLVGQAGKFPTSHATTNRQENWRHHGETWCSEVLVQIFVEFWLNQVPVSVSRDSFEVNVENRYSPHADHIHMIRIFVKHLHCFSNTMRHCSNVSFSSLPHSALDHLRKNVYTTCIQKRLYQFLRFSFDHWPLDASFRVLLELWLSVIQPWRYTSDDMGHESQDPKKERHVDERWKKYISENLLFFSAIFHQIIPRFFRMDLSTPENAYMLYRLLRVFSQPNMVKMIAQVEDSLCDSGMNPAANTLFSSAVRQSIAELEGHGYHYKAFLSDSSLIPELINTMVTTIRAAKGSVAHFNQQTHGFWTQVYLIIGGNGNSLEEEYIKSNSQKVEQRLTTALQNLCEIFSIKEPDFDSPVADNAINQGQSSADTDASTLSDVQDNECLNAEERRKIILGLSKPKNFGYRGNPDLQPIRSYECALLVRQLYVLSCLINVKFGKQIKDLYYARNDIASKILKSFLAPPIVFQSSTKGNSCKENLPPRICLRVFADYQNIGYLLSLYLIVYLLGYGPFSYLFIILGMLLSYASVKLLIKT